MALKVRPWTAQKAEALKRCASSRTAPHRVVPRAQLIWASAHGAPVAAMARQIGLSAFRVRAWIHRFTRLGLAGLADAPRSGRPRQHDEPARGMVLALARTKPRSLGFAVGALDLGAAAASAPGAPQASGNSGDELDVAAGCGRGVEAPAELVPGDGGRSLYQKRGPSSRPTRNRSRRGGSSALTNSAPSVPRRILGRGGGVDRAGRRCPLMMAGAAACGAWAPSSRLPAWPQPCAAPDGTAPAWCRAWN